MVSHGLTWSHLTERERERERKAREREGQREREGERERERGRERRDTHIQLISVRVLSVFMFYGYYLLSF